MNLLPTRQAVAAIAAAGAITIATALGGTAAASQSQPGAPPLEAKKLTATSTYIVQLAENPVVAYDGDIAGFARTRPARGDKINPRSRSVSRYAAYLDGRHNAVLATVGGRKVYDYRYTFNGFAAELSDAAAAKLAGTPGVLAVSQDELLQVDTADTPTFLGLDAAGGVWEQLGGPSGDKSHAGAGEDVIVGVIDTGIWPESKSFTDRDERGKLMYQQIPGWHGRCRPGEAFAASNCNQKLIGAQWFNEGYGGDAGIDADFPWEFTSARDGDIHGTHTASTAAGNYGVAASVGAIDFGTISGMAPRARIAAYKVCWGGDAGGCYSTDSVAAIDQAVADGVDVINFSISGSTQTVLDPVEVAFLFAADAGVFVAASAGNSGPTASTVNHISPWVTTVAASTHDRATHGSADLGDGSGISADMVSGASLADRASSSELAPFVYAADVATAEASADDAKLCVPGSLDSAAVSGTVVLCERGAIARTDKSLAVEQAGGIGMILVNPTPNSLNADSHYVPTVHIGDDYYDAIVAYAQSPGATARVNAATLEYGAVAPEMATFSSRGPAIAADGDVLKPDITAPGVDILAAVSPYIDNGRDFDFLSGTSMSSPHVAGIGALMKDLHPDWSPMMIKSAFMTSAYQTDTAGNVFGGPFDFGAGHIAPNSAADPGLVYDSSWDDWLGFLCGARELAAPYCSEIAIDPSDLNQASIAVGALAGEQDVIRTVTNVDDEPATYSVAVDAPAGVDVEVSPSALALEAGESASYTVTLTTSDDAAMAEYTTGSLTWTDGRHSVRSPIVVRPVTIAAPEDIFVDGPSTTYEVGFGYNGDFVPQVRGMVAAATIADTVGDDPYNDINAALANGVGFKIHTIDVPPATTYARFSLFDDYTSGDDDLDLYVIAPDGQVYSSGSGTSNEEVDLNAPPPGGYTVIVHGWQTDGGAPADYTLFSWALDDVAAGNLSVDAPPQAIIGQEGTVTVTISGLEDGLKYLGAIDYPGDVTTVVRADG